MNHVQHLDRTAQHFVALAANGLPQMFDKQRGLFCYRFKKTDRGLVREGLSRRYTIITLLGLDQLERAGAQSPIAPKPVFESLLADVDWVDNIGDLGLLLWLCAEMAPERLAEVGSRLQISTALARYDDAKTGRTMELAWFLSGLCHWGLADRRQLPALRDLAVKTYWKVQSNQGEYGSFGHLARDKSFSGRTRGWMGSFADQVYPIYALAKFAEAYQDDTAAQEALACAHVICGAQGPLGQWCWHYDSSSDRVIEGYPVFSVHQHGMGPMTLFALEAATQTDFSPWIYKGLEWVNAVNELGVDMQDTSASLIWRCIFRPSFKRYWDAALGRGMQPVEVGRPGQFRVLFECRPYELGWLLYAFASRSDQSHRCSEGARTLATYKAN